jgi:hypothetical protein
MYLDTNARRDGPSLRESIYLFEVIMDPRQNLNKIRWIFKGWDTCKCIVFTTYTF